MIAENLTALERRIGEACRRAGRSRNDVTLVAVSKTFPATTVDQAIAAGVTDVGENRVQEAKEKRGGTRGVARWHLIGHLQSNKARDAVQLFDMIQTIDSIALAEKVARAALALGKRQEVLIQVNIGQESQKSGVSVSEFDALLKAIRGLDALDLRGVMTIPPLASEEMTRRYFAELRALRESHGLEHASMGMSDDFEVAIEEGSTMIRVGRAIFGSRN